ncbi:MAG: hypothetical protein ABJE66_26080 [Deltaproteobacteria bacterium]
MTALEQLSVTAPRPEPLCGRYARKMDPWWGFVIAAAIWTVCSMTVVSLVGIEMNQVFGFADGSTGAKILTLALLATGGVAAVQAFRWWRHRRLASKVKLLRDGELVDVVVVTRDAAVVSRTSTIVELEGADRTLRCEFNVWFLPGEGETIKVLHHRELDHVVAFGRSGALYSGHVRRSHLR